MNIRIREEREVDFPAIYNLIEVAFQTANVKDGTEQDFANHLRVNGTYVPQLALVAVVEDKIVGHIMSTKTYVTMPNGERYDTLMVAPLSVALEYRNAGVGAALMKESFAIARTMGYHSAFLCGDPNYYTRFGYHPIGDFGITHDSIPAPYVMGCELEPLALSGITGVVRVE